MRTQNSGYLVNRDSTDKIRYWEMTLTNANGSIELITNYGLLLGENSTLVNSNDNLSKATTIYNRNINTKLNNGYSRLSSLGIHESIIKSAFVDNDVSVRKILDDRLKTLLKISKFDINNVAKPMKAQPFVVGKMNYPALGQPKINGLRAVISMTSSSTGEGMFKEEKISPVIRTKEGLIYHLPHISNYLSAIPSIFDGDIALDGEVYRHKTVLSDIRKRVSILKRGQTKPSNPSLNPEEVSFVIYDLSIPNVEQFDRLQMLYIIAQEYGIPIIDVTSGDKIAPYNVVILKHTMLHNDLETSAFRDVCLSNHFEGAIIRDTDAFYNFGGRRRNMLKAKKFKTSEFIVEDVILVNQDSRRTYIEFVLRNDTTDALFNCTPKGDESDRQEYLNNKHKYIGKTATVKYAERTVNDLPFHGNVVDVAREDKGDLDITEVGY